MKRHGAVAAALMVVAATALALSAGPAGAGRPGTPIAPLRDDEFRPVPSPSAVAVITDREHPARPDPTRPPMPHVDVPVRVVVSMPTSQVPPPPRASTEPKATTSHSLTGLASFYCWAGRSSCTVRHPDGPGFDAYAAAGPRLRVAMGGGVSVNAPQPWRGKIIWVNGLRVTLIDWCQCYSGLANEKIIDVYHDVYRRVGGNVTIRW